MTVQTRSFVRVTNPDALGEALTSLDAEVNAFLAALDWNAVLDVRYTVTPSPGDHPRWVGNLHYVVTVLYLEA